MNVTVKVDLVKDKNKFYYIIMKDIRKKKIVVIFIQDGSQLFAASFKMNHLFIFIIIIKGKLDYRLAVWRLPSYAIHPLPSTMD